MFKFIWNNVVAAAVYFTVMLLVVGNFQFLKQNGVFKTSSTWWEYPAYFLIGCFCGIVSRLLVEAFLQPKK